MKKNIFVFKYILIFTALLLFPAYMVVFAQDCSQPTLPDGQPNPCYNTGGSTNPINAFLYKVIDFLMAVGGGLGVVFLVLAGFYFVTARGDDRKIEKARTMVLWVIIGIAVVLLAEYFIGLVWRFVGGV